MQEEKALEKSQLVGNLSLGDQGDGNYPAGVVAGLRVVSRHHLQLQRDPQRQSAEKLRRSDRSGAVADLGGQDGDPGVHSLVDPFDADVGQGKSSQLRAQTGAARRRPAAPGRRRAHRQRRVSDHGEHRRAAGGDVEMASQKRAAGRLAGIVAGDFVLLSTGACRKIRCIRTWPNCSSRS